MRRYNRLALTPTEHHGARRILAVVFGVLLVALLAMDALAQERNTGTAFDLVGKVVGDRDQPLVGAFVSFADSDWGSLTDENGRFRIPGVVPGLATLEIEQLGYETLEWEGRVRKGDPLRFRMEAQPILLEGLTVVTDRFETRRRSTATSVRSYGRGDLANTPQETALDFIQVRAGLWPVRCSGAYTNQCFRVRGRVTEPVVWVDETPVIGGIEYLDALRPHELYMVEVYASGRHIRAYTNGFMERAAKQRLHPIALLF